MGRLAGVHPQARPPLTGPAHDEEPPGAPPAGQHVGAGQEVALLGRSDVRALAARLDLHPSKARGQNFVVDAGTVRRAVRSAGVVPGETVLEVGPGLGSLTLALLEAGAGVLAVEIDGRLAELLPETVAARAPAASRSLVVARADAMAVTGEQLLAASEGAGLAPPSRLVANLPYNVAVPVLLHLLAELPGLSQVLVMVQAEVAQRLAAPPGSRTYGVPSVKAAWHGDVELAGSVGPAVFWPAPRVDSSLVRLRRRPAPGSAALREEVFAVVDAAFSQRRKTLRSALAAWAGSPASAEAVLRAAGVDPGLRGERLALAEFVAIASRRDAAPLPRP